MISDAVPFETPPYIGLRPFQSDDSRLFFGRRPQVNALLDLLRHHRLLSVVGSSGCGKSSLIRAGLVPALRAGFLVEDRDRWDIATMTPGDSPLTNLATELVRACGLEESAETGGALLASLEELGEEAVVVWVEKHLGERKSLLLCVDQFEEIFGFRSAGPVADEGAVDRAARADAAYPNGSANASLAATASRRAEADQFVALLLELARRPHLPVYVVLTMRSDFLGDADVFRGLPEAMNETQYLVPRLTRETLGQAIVGPARLENATIAPRLLDRILNEAGDRADQLPVVQHALLRTWRQWRARDPEGEGPIQLADFVAAGTLDGALSADADAALEEVDAGLARRVFQCLTDTDLRKRRVRRSATVTELEAVTSSSRAQVTSILVAFRRENRHFVTLSGPPDDADTRVLITHESLIRCWPTLQRWVDEERDARDRFFEYARRAAQHQLKAGERLAGADLALARRWLASAKPTPSWVTRYAKPAELAVVLAYIDESRNAELIRDWSLRIFVVLIFLALATFTLLLIAEVKAAQAEKKHAYGETLRAIAAKSDTDRALLRSGDLAKLFVASRSTNLTEAAALLRDVVDRSMVGWSDIAYGVYGRGIPTWTLAVESPVWSVAVSPDGKHIASGSQDGAVRIWNADGRGSPLVLLGHQTGVNSVAFSADGRHLVSGSYDKTIRVWNTDGTGEATVFNGHEKEVNAVAFSPNGMQIVSGSNDETIRIWNVDGSGGSAVLGRCPHAEVSSVAFSPDGHRVVSGATDKLVRVWNVDGGKALVLKGHEATVGGTAFSPDGLHIVSAAADKTVRVWNADGSGRPLVFKGHDAEVLRVAFSPDGLRIASSSMDRTVRVWNTDGSGRPVVLMGHDDTVWSVAFSPDNHHVISGSADKTIAVWNVDGTGQPIALRGHEAGITAVAVSPDGRRVASGSQDKTMRIWNTDGTGLPLVRDGHGGSVWSVAFSPDGRRIGSAWEDATVRVWDTDGSDRPVLTISGHGKAVEGLAFSPDGRRIVVGSNDSTVRVWNMDGSGQPIALQLPDPAVVDSVAFSPDGQLIAAGASDNTVRIWNADGSGKPRVLYGLQNAIRSVPFRSVTFSPDGQRIAAGSTDNTVQVWNADGIGEPLILKGHDNEVLSVAFSPDGRHIVSVSLDNTMRIWNADGSGQPIVVPGPVQSVAFSGDGQHIVTGFSNNTIRVWPATTDLLMASLWAGGSACLTPARRQELLYEPAEESDKGYAACLKTLGVLH